MVDALGAEQPPAPVLEQGHLVGHRDLGRVQAVGGAPDGLSVRRLRRELDALAHGRRGDPGGGHRLLGEASGRLRRELDRGREPERPVLYDPYADTQLDVVRRGLKTGVAKTGDLGTDPLDTDLGVLAAERPARSRAAPRADSSGSARKSASSSRVAMSSSASSAAPGGPAGSDNRSPRRENVLLRAPLLVVEHLASGARCGGRSGGMSSRGRWRRSPDQAPAAPRRRPQDGRRGTRSSPASRGSAAMPPRSCARPGIPFPDELNGVGELVVAELERPFRQRIGIKAPVQHAGDRFAGP